jgi:hypothetical protein
MRGGRLCKTRVILCSLKIAAGVPHVQTFVWNASALAPSPAPGLWSKKSSPMCACVRVRIITKGIVKSENKATFCICVNAQSLEELYARGESAQSLRVELFSFWRNSCSSDMSFFLTCILRASLLILTPGAAIISRRKTPLYVRHSSRLPLFAVNHYRA